MKRPYFFTLSLVLLLLSASSGLLAGSEQDPAVALKNRTHSLMQAKVAGDWDEVYDHFWSGFRDQISEVQFLNKTKTVMFKDYSIEDIELTGDGHEAVVTVSNDCSIQGYELEGALDKQAWIYENGRWFQKVEPDSKAGLMAK
ncbi:MAG: hypothetical protein K9J81_11800 [Desulfohalobiaceae bacterium]|nr:hypothetical protein [Desulfohalobiaceae bacterium]